MTMTPPVTSHKKYATLIMPALFVFTLKVFILASLIPIKTTTAQTVKTLPEKTHPHLTTNSIININDSARNIVNSTNKSGRKNIAPVTREAFLAYQDINDFIAQSPVVTRVAPPDSNDIATHGPEVVKLIQGADCNRDGEVDTHKQCIKAFYDLWVRFNR